MMKNIILALLLSMMGFNAFANKELNLVDTNGVSFSLNDYKGKVILLDFWASWCIPCRASFPWMSEMQNKYKAQGLEVIAVNLDKSRSEVDRFLKVYPAEFTILLDPSGESASRFKVKAMPTSFLINKEGKLVSSHLGFKTSKTSEYELEIQNLLKE